MVSSVFIVIITLSIYGWIIWIILCAVFCHDIVNIIRGKGANLYSFTDNPQSRSKSDRTEKDFGPPEIWEEKQKEKTDGTGEGIRASPYREQ